MTNTPNNFKYSWPIEATMDIIGGKWKSLILYKLNGNTLRFSQILNQVKPRITQRMLTKILREMEKDGLVIRKVYPEVPPRVEYSLTAKAESLIPVLDQLCEWGSEHMEDDIEFKCEE